MYTQFKIFIEGLYGHSAVFHASSNTIYTFGGFEYLTDKTVATSNLYGLDLNRPIWTLLSPESENRVSSSRFVYFIVQKTRLII